MVSGRVAVIDLLSRAEVGCSRFRERHSPSVTYGFRVAMACAVLLPERFRGCCTFGATDLAIEVVDSPAPPFQQPQITPSAGGAGAATL